MSYRRLRQPDYARRLNEFCANYFWTPHDGPPDWCNWLMLDPRHTCLWEGGDCPVDWALRRYPKLELRPSCPNLDHTEILRRGTAAEPTQWAVLSQPYHQTDPSGSAMFLGEAPYGHGSFALLYVGERLDSPLRLQT